MTRAERIQQDSDIVAHGLHTRTFGTSGSESLHSITRPNARGKTRTLFATANKRHRPPVSRVDEGSLRSITHTATELSYCSSYGKNNAATGGHTRGHDCQHNGAAGGAPPTA